MKVQDKNDPKFLNKRVCHRPSLSITGPSIFKICIVQVIVVKYFHLTLSRYILQIFYKACQVLLFYAVVIARWAEGFFHLIKNSTKMYSYVYFLISIVYKLLAFNFEMCCVRRCHLKIYRHNVLIPAVT